MPKYVSTLYKQPGESRLFDMDFSHKMRTGETIVSVDSIAGSPAGLVFGTGVISGQVVQVLISGGSMPTRPDCEYNEYVVTFTITTDASQVLEEEGILRIQETPVS